LRFGFRSFSTAGGIFSLSSFWPDFPANFAFPNVRFSIDNAVSIFRLEGLARIIHEVGT
jgi:hypothetical protein